MNNNKIKTLLWDIETAHNLCADLGYMICFGYKWLHEDKAHCKTIADFKSFKNNPHDDSQLVKFAYETISQADHIVAHYGDKFDRRYLNTRLLIHNFPTLPSGLVLKQTDTCKIGQKQLKFHSNRLDAIAKALGLETKMDKDWPGWWLKAMAGHKQSIKDMAEYCLQDVIVLEQVYKRIGHLDNQHPHRNILDEMACSFCGGNHVTSRGKLVKRTGIYRRYQCQDCGKWMQSSKAIAKADLS